MNRKVIDTLIQATCVVLVVAAQAELIMPRIQNERDFNLGMMWIVLCWLVGVGARWLVDWIRGER